MPKRYWLFKSEPNAYSYDDLERDQVAEWDGVRNYQARNLLRDEIGESDEVLFYHSGGTALSVAGTAKVVRSGYPDHTAWEPDSEHPDPKSSPENPIWYMVDIAPGMRFARPVPLAELRTVPALHDMALLRKGIRLSVQPVTEEEFETVVELGGG